MPRLSLAPLLLFALACRPHGDAAGIEVLAQFDPQEGEHPEALVLSPDGELFVALHEAGAVWARHPDGSSRRIALPRNAEGTRVNGLAFTDALYALVRSEDPAVSGVWRMDDAPERVAALEAGAGLNGLDAHSDGRLFATDDDGRVLMIDVARGTSKVWAQGPELEPTSEGGYGPTTYGANGIDVTDEAVWVSLPAHGAVVALPMAADGAWSGAVDRSRTDLATVGVVDDFDLEAGRFIGGALSDDAVWLVDEAGRRELALRGDGVDQPTAALFDPDDDRAAFVTNGAFYRFAGTRRPSVMRVHW